ncbi:uncharacterized protein MCYG_04354 [Microsporum canis CBS 113480]|uniref:Uncharacterized protein n=1 Tax=Arthroderma otae (strain ATCC MYA-4605 / CBS 113480) TaxID=554155 RepID=C5FPL9_ARTOC|nr:uncharacterized protein MCYG_04354 [Microsporum canis CBS 113480]EEQ31535.1 predicted protein [Microsporum canis CBS 113480]
MDCCTTIIRSIAPSRSYGSETTSHGDINGRSPSGPLKGEKDIKGCNFTLGNRQAMTTTQQRGERYICILPRGCKTWKPCFAGKEIMEPQVDSGLRGCYIPS